MDVAEDKTCHKRDKASPLCWLSFHAGSDCAVQGWLFLSLQDSPMHKALFWVAMAVLQLDEVNLYSAGTALLEQNLHTLDSLRVFNDKVRHSLGSGCRHS